jgi:Bacterial Ig domain/CARDB
LQTESRLELGLVNRERDLITNTAVYSFNSNYNFNHPDGTHTFGSIDYGFTTDPWFEMLYKASEDVEWPDDLTVEIATSPFANNESILGKDIVGWYFGRIGNVNNVMAAINPNPWRATGITFVASWVNTVQPDVVVDRVDYFNGSFVATVRNQGDFIVPPNKVIGVGFSVDGVYRTWAAQLGGMRPGSLSSIYTTNFPDRRYLILDGDHVITAWVDDVNRFAESDETNNKLSKAISLTGPDYTQPYVKLTSPLNNSTVTGSVVTVSAKAQDNVRVTGVKFSLHDYYFGAEYPIGTDTTVPYVISWDSTQVNSGTYTLVATAYDAAGHQKEDSIRVIVKPPLSLQRPDIVVTDLAYANGQFSCAIKNRGGEPIPADAWLGFGYFVDGKQKTWTYTTGPLASGESRTLGVTGGGAFTIPSGTHTIKVVADDQSSVAEFDETNNVLSKTITVP